MDNDIENANANANANIQNGNRDPIDKTYKSFEDVKPLSSRMKILKKRTAEKVISRLKKFVHLRATSERNVKKLEKISERKTIAVNYDSSVSNDIKSKMDIRLN